MGWWLCNGRECKLGWGYNNSLDQLIPIEEEPLNVTSHTVNQWEYWVFSFSSNIVVYWVSFYSLVKFSINVLAILKSLSGTEL